MPRRATELELETNPCTASDYRNFEDTGGRNRFPACEASEEETSEGGRIKADSTISKA